MPSEPNGKTLYILTATKALIAIMLVGTLCYMLATGKPIPDFMLQVFLALGGAYFGISTKAYYESSHDRSARIRLTQEYWKGRINDNGE